MKAIATPRGTLRVYLEVDMTSSTQSKTIRVVAVIIALVAVVMGLSACSNDEKEVVTEAVDVYPEAGDTNGLVIVDGGVFQCDPAQMASIPVKQDATVTYNGFTLKGEWGQDAALVTVSKDNEPSNELPVQGFTVVSHAGDLSQVGRPTGISSSYRLNSIDWGSIGDIQVCVIGA